MRWIHVNVRQQFVQHLIATHPSSFISVADVCLHVRTNQTKTKHNKKSIYDHWMVLNWFRMKKSDSSDLFIVDGFFFAPALSCIVNFDDIEIKCFDFIGFSSPELLTCFLVKQKNNDSKKQRNEKKCKPDHGK